MLLFVHTERVYDTIMTFWVLAGGTKTLPAVFSCRHHDVLELSIRAAHPTVNVPGSALHRRQQPGPADGPRVHVCRLLLPGQNQVAELLRLRHMVLQVKELVKA